MHSPDGNTGPYQPALTGDSFPAGATACRPAGAGLRCQRPSPAQYTRHSHAAAHDDRLRTVLLGDLLQVIRKGRHVFRINIFIDDRLALAPEDRDGQK